MTNRASQYQSLLLSLIGQRGNINREDFASIHQLIQSGLSPPKIKKQTSIERSKYKQSRDRFVKRNFPMFTFSYVYHCFNLQCCSCV